MFPQHCSKGIVRAVYGERVRRKLWQERVKKEGHSQPQDRSAHQIPQTKTQTEGTSIPQIQLTTQKLPVQLLEYPKCRRCSQVDEWVNLESGKQPSRRFSGATRCQVVGRMSDSDNKCILKCLETAMLCSSVMKCCWHLSQYVRPAAVCRCRRRQHWNSKVFGRKQIDLSNKKMFSFYSGRIFHS